MLIQIRHRYTSAVLFEADAKSVALAVKAAQESEANLRGADLSEANLREANLREANLSEANLSGADLSGADLNGANLHWANLHEANLGEANLSGANLSEANLRWANLSGADLSGANLNGANLHEANLSGANGLEGIKGDFWAVLLRAPREVAGLIAALKEGRVDGSQYQGECACLVGTIANVAQLSYEQLPNGLVPNASRLSEQWFMAIRQGDTPATNPISQLTVQWAEEFQELLALATYSEVSRANA